MEKFNVPASFYITTGMLNETREYWWDELEQILLKPGKIPNELLIEIEGKQHQWALGKAVNYAETQYKEDFHLKPWESQDGSRLQFYYSVWQYLQPLQESERTKLIRHISQWAGSGLLLRESHRPLNEIELKELCNNELFEIGAHTIKHPSLPKLTEEQQTQEILCSKDVLEKITQRYITSFAYPHGEYSKETINILQSGGFQNACTTDEAAITLKQSLFELPRFQVEDWDGKTFRKILHKKFGIC